MVKRPNKTPDPGLRSARLGLAGWVVPGLTHWLIGQRGRGAIFFVCITATFWTGVAVGGAYTTLGDPENRPWLIAQIGAGGNVVAGLVLGNKIVTPRMAKADYTYRSYWPASDIGIVYTAVAGLLNVLVILDGLVRADRMLAPETAGAERGGR